MTFHHDLVLTIDSLCNINTAVSCSIVLENLHTQNCKNTALSTVSDYSLDIMWQAHAQQYSTELLQAELERTRINTACFVESIPLDSVPEPAKVAYAFRGSMDASSNTNYTSMNSPSRNYRGAQSVGSPSFSRHRRR